MAISVAVAAVPRKRHRGLTRFMRNRAAVAGAVIVLLIVIVAVFFVFQQITGINVPFYYGPQLLGGLFILAGVAVVRAEESRPVRIGGRDSSAHAGSATEADLSVGVPLVGHGPIVADDRVEGDGVDVPAAEDHRGVVGAVQEQRPL